MSLKEIIDRRGRQFKWIQCSGVGYFESMAKGFFPNGLETRLKELKTLEIRDDDIIICAFPKSGTHWTWEIVSMVTKESAEYEPKTKRSLMIEFQSLEKLESAPSPRILNCHYPISYLPDQLFSKQTKIIFVIRNPKDVAVSMFHHVKQMDYDDEDWFNTFSDFLPYVTGEYGVYFYVSLFEYFKEMIKFCKQNPTQVLILHFEEMKKNLEDVVRNVATFLNKNLSNDVIRNIAEKCLFQNLKLADELLKQKEDFARKLTPEEREKREKKGPVAIYRKGEVGDWKDYFTVAENELFDHLLKERLRNVDIEFIFS